MSERFRIPQKLYGREAEIARLLDLFEQAAAGERQVVFYAGAPGIGKTALINEVHKPMVLKRGYVIAGKYDQLNRDLPYSAIIQAFRDLMRQLLSEPDAALQSWKERIQAAVGEVGQALVDLIPELELIIGPQPALPALGPNEAQNRLRFVFQDFVRVFAAPEHPLVLFLDDLQWADLASLGLLQEVMADPQLRACLFVCAYRDNEVSASHPLRTMLFEGLQTYNQPCHEVAVNPLQETHIAALLADTLACEPDAAMPLAAVVRDKTAGNPFFVGAFLQRLYTDGLIVFDRGWQWDATAITRAEITGNVVTLMAEKLRALPPETLSAITTAACVGVTCDLATLSAISNQPEETLLLSLRPAVDAGVLLMTGSDARFVHDRVQEAAYSLLDETERVQLHATIGQHLLTSLDAAGREERLFALVSHLNHARSMLNPAEQQELLALNLRAGQKAKASGAYAAAAGLLRHGVELLPSDAWEANYALTFPLHLEYAEAKHLARDDEGLDTLFEELLDKSQGVLDAVKVYLVKMSYLGANLKLAEAIEIGRQALARLGIELPAQGGMELVLPEVEEVGRLMQGRAVEDLLHLPLMTDPESLAVLSVFTAQIGVAFGADPVVYILTQARAVQFSIRFGNAPDTALAYTAYGYVLAGMGDLPNGHGFAKLGLKLSERFDSKKIRGQVAWTYAAGTAGLYLERPFKDALEALTRAYPLSLEGGDLFYASCFYQAYAFTAFFSAQHIPNIIADFLEPSTADLARLRQKYMTRLFNLWKQCFLNLAGQAENVFVLTGTALDEARELKDMQRENNGTGLGYYYTIKTFLGLLLERHAQANALAAEGETVTLTTYAGTHPAYAFALYYALNLTAVYADLPDQPAALEKIQGFHAMLKPPADFCPLNYQNKYLLVSAELARIEGRDMEAMRLYDESIDYAKKGEFLHEEGLANECAARFYLANNVTTSAQVYLRNAHYCYERWGAAAKVKQLEEKYPQYVGKAARDAEQRAAAISAGTTNITTTMTTGGGAAAILDATTMIKASQALSQEVETEKLLDTLLRFTLENAGATRGLLLEPQNSHFVVQAERSAMESLHSPTGAEPTPDPSQEGNDGREASVATTASHAFPLAVVQQAARTSQPVLLNNVSKDSVYRSDPYLQTQPPQALLCLPIVHQGSVTALLYLENGLSANAFTPERLELLNVLAAQAAISLENARYVENLAEQERLKREMELAQRIQSAILPRLDHSPHPDFEIEAVMLPADEVGGDYYDVTYGKDGSLWLAIGDVSGHGVTPGLIMMMAQTFHAGFTAHMDAEPKDVINMLNASLFRNVTERLEADHFMTFTTLKYKGQGRFDFAGAHLDLIVHRAATNTCDLFDTPGCYLNFIPNIEHATQQHSFSMDVGDTLVLYTDGLTEAQNPDGELLEDRRFTDIVTRHAAKAPAGMRDGIMQDVLAYSHGERKDDMTLVVVRRTA